MCSTSVKTVDSNQQDLAPIQTLPWHRGPGQGPFGLTLALGSLVRFERYGVFVLPSHTGLKKVRSSFTATLSEPQ